jgi:hypothetical protein
LKVKSQSNYFQVQDYSYWQYILISYKQTIKGPKNSVLLFKVVDLIFQHPDSYNKDWQDGLRALLPNINISFGASPQSSANSQKSTQNSKYSIVLITCMWSIIKTNLVVYFSWVWPSEKYPR